MKKFQPLSFDLLEEGRLKSSVDESLRDARARLFEHVSRYGTDATTKSKAKISLEITIAPEAASAEEDGKAFSTYAIESRIKTTLPGRPAVASLAIHDADQATGEQILAVRASGSTDGENPRQLKLATKDGRPIDPTTGEVKETPNKKDLGQ